MRSLPYVCFAKFVFYIGASARPYDAGFTPVCMTSQKRIGHTMAMNYGLDKLSKLTVLLRRDVFLGGGGEGGCKLLHACNTWGITGFMYITGNCVKKA